MKKTFRKHGVLYTWDSEAWDEDNQSKGAVVSGKDLKTGLEVRLGDKVPGYGGPEPFYTVVHFDPESDSVFTGDSEGYWSDYEFAHVAEEVKEWKEMQAKQSSADDDIELNFNNYSVTPAAPADALLAMGDVDEELDEANQAGRFQDISHGLAIRAVKSKLTGEKVIVWGSESPLFATIDGKKRRLFVRAITPDSYTTKGKYGTQSAHISNDIDINNPDDILVLVVFKENNNPNSISQFYIPAYRLGQQDTRFKARSYQIDLHVDAATCKDEFREFRYKRLSDNLKAAEEFFANGGHNEPDDTPAPRTYQAARRVPGGVNGYRSQLEETRHIAQKAIKEAIDADGRIDYNAYLYYNKTDDSYRACQIGIKSSGNYLMEKIDSDTQICVAAETVYKETIEKLDELAAKENIRYTYINKHGDRSIEQDRGFTIHVADARNLTDAELQEIVDKLYLCYRLLKRVLGR